ncbi:flagellar basal body P-ring formation chaperone FlgA [Acidimangrovimonas sediminis]|uniref:flagellar basal body P-ring formation chaperone FlgA n=1 Tax=Acidimangrovimonas sediminis TaxID=2056283 RepID=UPI000C80E37F|nr:flagellar basal body P-ring formation chaperone FlgA [Acidimangrovimonas sediminis]
MRRVLLLALIALAAAPAALPARAAQVTQLIAEKAAADTGGAMPPAGRYDVTLTPGDVAEATLVSAFVIDRSTGQFAANVVTGAGETWRVTGLATLTVPVPVPVRRILPDELLTKADFTMVALPYRQLGSFAVTSLDRLQGMQVRRVLAAGRPVMVQSVTPPIVIGKGDKVSLEYRKGNMQLSAPGRAITSAEADQEVRVINLVSNRTVTGIARAAGIVEVSK